MNQCKQPNHFCPMKLKTVSVVQFVQKLSCNVQMGTEGGSVV